MNIKVSTSKATKMCKKHEKWWPVGRQYLGDSEHTETFFPLAKYSQCLKACWENSTCVFPHKVDILDLLNRAAVLVMLSRQ